MERDFAVHDSVYRLGPGRHLTSKREEEGKGACSLARAELSSYLYRLYVTCVHLSMLGVVSTPPQ
jgi:hypothetical protein